jgi:hypothetical protein
MKKALISKLEPVRDGFRVAQVIDSNDIFEVAADLFWADCADDVVADLFWYDPLDSKIKLVSEPVVSTETGTSGVQTL